MSELLQVVKIKAKIRFKKKCASHPRPMIFGPQNKLLIKVNQKITISRDRITQKNKI